MPTRAQIKGSGGFPFPTQHQYSHAWHHDGKGAQPGAKLMIDNGAEVAEDWTRMQTSGYAMSFLQVPAKAAVATSNSFAALTSEEPESQDSDGGRDPVPCVAAPIPVASALQRASRPAKLMGVSRRCSGPMASHCRHESCTGKMAAADSVLQPCRPKLGVKAFLEKRTQSLRPLAAGWEKFQAIVDSGASVTVVPPHVGRDYEVIRGEAAMAGVRYEIADGNEIPNLGEKLMPVMTREGTWRGLKAEVADIARALQSCAQPGKDWAQGGLWRRGERHGALHPERHDG